MWGQKQGDQLEEDIKSSCNNTTAMTTKTEISKLLIKSFLKANDSLITAVI